MCMYIYIEREREGYLQVYTSGQLHGRSRENFSLAEALPAAGVTAASRAALNLYTQSYTNIVLGPQCLKYNMMSIIQGLLDLQMKPKLWASSKTC